MLTIVPEGCIPNLKIDCTIFGFDGSKLKVLLTKIDTDPFKNFWALPDGWIGENENTDDAATRITLENTGVNNIYLTQLKSFGKTCRFPTYRMISIAYTALINPENYDITESTDNQNTQWFNVSELPSLAFDHDNIIDQALKNLRIKFLHEPVSFELLPKKFTMPQILSLYESILGKELDRRNFRKKILKMDILERLEEKQLGVAHRAAYLYRFNEIRYKKSLDKSFNFDF